MDAEQDLEAFRAAWERDADGPTGRRYAEALAEAGRTEEALAVCEAMWAAGWVAGRTDAAWIEHERGDTGRAIALLAGALDHVDEEDLPGTLATLGRWRWEAGDDYGAEPLLTAAAGTVPAARVDLAGLLGATGRRGEARRVLEDGVAAGVVECMLPLANVLDEEGETDRALDLYARSFAAGDAYAAWNLALTRGRLGRMAEADAWRWRAARAGDEVAIESLLAQDGLRDG